MASEIGILSGQTSDALQQSGDIIKSSSVIIQKGLEIAQQTANAFSEIQNVTEQYFELSTKLSNTVKTQTTTVEGVNNQLSSLQTIADENRDLAEKTDKMADSFLTQSKNLKDFVEKVKIKDYQ